MPEYPFGSGFRCGAPCGALRCGEPAVILLTHHEAAALQSD